MEALQPYVPGWLVPTVLSAVFGYALGVLKKVETYRQYRKFGGNHDAKQYMTALLGEDADAYLATHTE